MDLLASKICDIFKNDIIKVIISKKFDKNCTFKKIEIEKKVNGFLISKFTETQVFHLNIKTSEISENCIELIKNNFLQLNAFSAEKEYILLLSKKGAVTLKIKEISNTNIPKQNNLHDNQKQHILKQGYDIKPLVDMGVFTSEFKVAQGMQQKFRQINRFLEVVDHECRKVEKKHLNIIDFGCGKSYLTFILYYYLTQIKNHTVTMVGLDLKKEVIKKCNACAEKYGYDGLRFELGDINGYKTTTPIDMVVTLHACDTATDYALYNAVLWNAKMIFSVPCCQHELNEKIKPTTLKLLSKYGLVKERFSALVTDSIRADLLEYCGYKTQLVEFADFQDTPKNILIKAIKKGKGGNKSLEDVNAILTELNTTQTLHELLKNADIIKQ